MTAIVLHAEILGLMGASLSGLSETTANDSIPVAILPPILIPDSPPTPKPERTASSVHPAETTLPQPERVPIARPARIFLPSMHPLPLMALPFKTPLLPAAPLADAAADISSTDGSEAANDSKGSMERDYLKRLYAYIDQRQKKFTGTRNRLNDAVVLMVLDEGGKLVGVGISISSGEKALDDQVLHQLVNMSPFPQPPKEEFMTEQFFGVRAHWLFHSYSLQH